VWIRLTNHKTEYKLTTSVDALISVTHPKHAIYNTIMYKLSHTYKYNVVNY